MAVYTKFKRHRPFDATRGVYAVCGGLACAVLRALHHGTTDGAPRIAGAPAQSFPPARAAGRIRGARPRGDDGDLADGNEGLAAARRPDPGRRGPRAPWRVEWSARSS